MAVEPGDVDFISTLDEASKRRAKDELNELNDQDRASAVQTFRQWILQQSWLRTPTDFEFLLRFLRVRKFSQLGARQTIENYWRCRSQGPQWFRDVDPADPMIQEILRTGFYISPKRYDSEGRRIVMEAMGRIPKSKLKTWGVKNILRTIILVCDWANKDERAQVNGLLFFVDGGDFTMEQVKIMFEMDSNKKLMQYFEKALPMRMKGIHMYNEPTFFDVVYAMFKPFMSQKTIDRMTMHGKNMANVYKTIEKCCLPDEYLPDDYEGPRAGTREQLIEEMIADMLTPEFREYMVRLSSDKYGLDVKKQKEEEQVPAASFRKLNVD